MTTTVPTPVVSSGESEPEVAALAGAQSASEPAGPRLVQAERLLTPRLFSHVLAAALVQASWMGVQFFIPLLAKKKFGATDWESLAITASPLVLASLAIFWGDLFARVRVSRYLLAYWMLAALPLVVCGWAPKYPWLLAAWIVSAVGTAGFPPLAGELYRAMYAPAIRGRAYAVVWGSSMTLGALAGYALARLMTLDEASVHYSLPLAAGLQGAGCVLFWLLSKRTGHTHDRSASLVRRDDSGLSLGQRIRRLLEPIGHMGGILRADPVFARYEAGYMTYGIGWMIGWALMPIFVVDKLHLNYDQSAQATHMPYLFALVAASVPAGMLLDKIGAFRATALSFGLLALYPLSWALVTSENQLLFVSVLYGLVHAGANVGWMLGPVSLAPSPEKVPQYVAIHATLVGVRGMLFQFLGVLLYNMTKSFTIPLLVAAAAYLWAGWQMWRLHSFARTARPAKA